MFGFSQRWFLSSPLRTRTEESRLIRLGPDRAHALAPATI